MLEFEIIANIAVKQNWVLIHVPKDRHHTSLLMPLVSTFPRRIYILLIVLI